MLTIGLLLGLPLAAGALGIWHWGRARPWSQWRADLLLALGCLALTIGYFWQVLFLPGTSFPAGGGDLVAQFWPAYHFAARSVVQGTLPFWNPSLYNGMPFAADIQSAVFYPTNLVAWLLARSFSYRALELLVMAHLLLAALNMAACCRLLGLGRPAALGGAAIYAYSGFMAAHLGHANILAVAAWAPLAFGLFHRALQEGRLLLALSAGAVVGVALLAGHPQMGVLLTLLLLAAAAWAWGRARPFGQLRRSRGPSGPGGPRLLLLLAVAGLMALGVAGIALVPFLELSLRSVRQILTYSEAAQFALEPQGLLLFLLPRFFGASPGDYWGLNSLTESYSYLGLLSLLLAMLGAVAPGGHPWRGFFVLLTLGGLLVALGQATVLHGWLYQLLPLFDRIRVPGRLLFFVTFGLSFLAACGLEALAGPRRGRLIPTLRLLLRGGLTALALLGFALPWLAFAVLTSQNKDRVLFERTVASLESALLAALFLALALGLLWLHRRHPVPWGARLAFALLVVDLFSANSGFNLMSREPTEGYEHPAIAAYLTEQPRPFRVDPVTGIADRFQPAWSQLQGYEDVYGVFNPLRLRSYDRYWENLGSRSNPAYDLLGASFLIAAKEVVLDWEKFEPAFSEAPTLNVYRNRRALPPALLVPQAEALPSEELWRRLREGPWDPRALLLVESEPPPLDGSPSTGPLELYSWERPNVNQLRLRVQAEGAGYLLLSQSYYPGWRATVDGELAPLFQADGIFPALPLSAGEHAVELRFQPTGWPWLFGANLLAWAVGLALGLLAFRRRPWPQAWGLAATRPC